MGINMKKILFLLLFAMVAFSLTGKAFAYSGAMSVSPTVGTYITNTKSTASVVLDGAGVAFNAAKATVDVSSNLSLQNLVIGDCNFAFVVTPTVANPSFAGVILGGSTKKCTLYTMTILPTKAGTGTITLSKASIKSYQGAKEILSLTQSAQYSVSGVSVTPQASMATSQQQFPPAVDSRGVKLYNIVVSVDNFPNGAEILIDKKSAQTKNALVIEATGSFRQVVFVEIPEGVHTVSVYYKNKEVASSVITASGKNRNLILGMSVQKNNNTLLLIGISLAIIVLAIVCTLLVNWLRKELKKSKEPSQKPNA
jgi:hypothetical protein